MLYANLEETQLIGLCIEKDQLAFKELVGRYFGKVENLIKKYIKDQPEIDDVIQETFIKLWKNIKRFKEGNSMKPWLFTIARNSALDNLKKRKNISFSELDDNQESSILETFTDDYKIASEIYEDEEKLAVLRTAMQSLHPDHRTILSLHYEEELTFEDISKVVNKPMNTVKSWHRRALILLRKLMNETLHQS
jgi:RNA polymerase sigma-70 factor (ECF subfamily)